MANARFRRRRLLIDRRVQLRHAVVAGGSLLGYSVLLGFLIFFPLQRSLLDSASPEQQVFIADQILELHQRVWPAVMAVAVLIGFQSVIMTHRMLGPAYRVKIALNALRAGQLSHRVVLRRHDQLKDLAEAFNQLAVELQRVEAGRAEREASLLARITVLEQELERASVGPAPTTGSA